MRPIAALISFREASNSGSPWHAPWGQIPPFCCSMSHCRHLMRRLACDCWGRSLIYSGNRGFLSSTSPIVRLTRFGLGDSALILNAGRIVQEGKPAEVFNAPRDSAVSRAVGSENILAGRVHDHNEREGISVIDLGGCQLVIPYNALPKTTPVTIGIRSDDIIVSRERIGQTSARNLLEGTIKHVVQDGQEVDLLTACGVDLKVRVTAQALAALDLKPGVKVYLLIKASSCHLLS